MYMVSKPFVKVHIESHAFTAVKRESIPLTVIVNHRRYKTSVGGFAAYGIQLLCDESKKSILSWSGQDSDKKTRSTTDQRPPLPWGTVPGSSSQ